MSQDVYRFCFGDKVSAEDAHSTFMLALVAAESLHGMTAVRMDCRFRCDVRERRYDIYAGSGIGSELARIFAGFVIHSHGPGAVHIRRGEPSRLLPSGGGVMLSDIAEPPSQEIVQ